VAHLGQVFDWLNLIVHSLSVLTAHWDFLEVHACHLTGLVFAARSLSLGNWLQSDYIGRCFRPTIYQSGIYASLVLPDKRIGWNSLHWFKLWDCYNHHNPRPNIPLASFPSPLELHFLAALCHFLDRTWQFLGVRDVVEAGSKLRGQRSMVNSWGLRVLWLAKLGLWGGMKGPKARQGYKGWRNQSLVSRDVGPWARILRREGIPESA